jgi:hypothetical protein
MSEVEKLAKTALEFPPTQAGGSFNLDAVKKQIQKAMQSHHGQWRFNLLPMLGVCGKSAAQRIPH